MPTLLQAGMMLRCMGVARRAVDDEHVVEDVARHAPGSSLNMRVEALHERRFVLVLPEVLHHEGFRRGQPRSRSGRAADVSPASIALGSTLAGHASRRHGVVHAAHHVAQD